MPRPPGRAPPYTPADDLSLICYMLFRREFSYVGGNELWKSAEGDGLLQQGHATRSWQSMRERWKKHIPKFLSHYRVHEAICESFELHRVPPRASDTVSRERVKFLDEHAHLLPPKLRKAYDLERRRNQSSAGNRAESPASEDEIQEVSSRGRARVVVDSDNDEDNDVPVENGRKASEKENLEDRELQENKEKRRRRTLQSRRKQVLMSRSTSSGEEEVEVPVVDPNEPSTSRGTRSVVSDSRASGRPQLEEPDDDDVVLSSPTRRPTEIKAMSRASNASRGTEISKVSRSSNASRPTDISEVSRTSYVSSCRSVLVSTETQTDGGDFVSSPPPCRRGILKTTSTSPICFPSPYSTPSNCSVPEDPKIRDRWAIDETEMLKREVERGGRAASAVSSRQSSRRILMASSSSRLSQTASVAVIIPVQSREQGDKGSSGEPFDECSRLSPSGLPSDSPAVAVVAPCQRSTVADALALIQLQYGDGSDSEDLSVAEMEGTVLEKRVIQDQVEGNVVAEGSPRQHFEDEGPGREAKNGGNDDRSCEGGVGEEKEIEPPLHCEEEDLPFFSLPVEAAEEFPTTQPPPAEMEEVPSNEMGPKNDVPEENQLPAFEQPEMRTTDVTVGSMSQIPASQEDGQQNSEEKEGYSSAVNLTGAQDEGEVLRGFLDQDDVTLLMSTGVDEEKASNDSTSTPDVAEMEVSETPVVRAETSVVRVETPVVRAETSVVRAETSLKEEEVPMEDNKPMQSRAESAAGSSEPKEEYDEPPPRNSKTSEASHDGPAVATRHRDRKRFVKSRKPIGKGKTPNPRRAPERTSSATDVRHEVNSKANLVEPVEALEEHCEASAEDLWIEPLPEPGSSSRKTSSKGSHQKASGDVSAVVDNPHKESEQRQRVEPDSRMDPPQNELKSEEPSSKRRNASGKTASKSSTGGKRRASGSRAGSKSLTSRKARKGVPPRVDDEQRLKGSEGAAFTAERSKKKEKMKTTTSSPTTGAPDSTSGPHPSCCKDKLTENKPRKKRPVALPADCACDPAKASPSKKKRPAGRIQSEQSSQERAQRLAPIRAGGALLNVGIEEVSQLSSGSSASSFVFAPGVCSSQILSQGSQEDGMSQVKPSLEKRGSSSDEFFSAPSQPLSQRAVVSKGNAREEGALAALASNNPVEPIFHEDTPVEDHAVNFHPRTSLVDDTNEGTSVGTGDESTSNDDCNLTHFALAAFEMDEK